MSLSAVFCIIFSGIAMIMDIKWEKVFNFWICTGLLCGQLLLIYGDEPVKIFVVLAGTMTPFVVLFPLFLCKMLGTGDIKVFAVLGSVMTGLYDFNISDWSSYIGSGVNLSLQCERKISIFFKISESCLYK